MVTFFLPGERDLSALARLDPDRDWHELVVGERAWILQTYLRLARLGAAVRLAGEPTAGEIVVFHSKHERALLRHRSALRESLLIGVRADNREPLAADLEVVQNQVFSDGRRRHFLPHWPQPGLVGRDPRRDGRVERVTFKGFAHNLDPAFRSAAWSERLAALGVEWHFDAIEFSGPATSSTGAGWPDFSETDVILAVRPPRGGRLNAKPATKLTNAWMAGVPALLGPEPAYRELRRSPLDYLEVRSAAEAEAAVLRLRNDPGLYRAMVENGQARGAEFTFAATTERWRRFLFETVPSLVPSAFERRMRALPLAARRASRRVVRLLEGRPAR